LSFIDNEMLLEYELFHSISLLKT